MSSGARRRGASTSKSSKRAAEDVVEHREDVADVHMGEIVLAADALMAKLIVSPALAIVGENFIRLGAFLEPNFRRCLIAVSAIRVILHRQPSIGALDLVAIRCSGDAKDFVIISLR